MKPTLAILCLVLGLAGCRSCDQNRKEKTAPAASISKRPVTTSAPIAWGNLDSDIEQRLKHKSTRAAESYELVQMLLMRADARGKTADLELAETVATNALAQFPNDWEPRFAMAKIHGAFHRFDKAMVDIDEAEKLAGPSQRYNNARASILMARGQYAEAKKLLPEHPTDSSEIATSAVLAARMGRLDEAKKRFEEARIKFESVSPFPLAWMDFQRATILDLQGRETEAKAYYAEIIAMLPGHAHAAIHLANASPGPAALEMLNVVRDTSDDPDVIAAAAAANARSGNTTAANALIEEAKTKFTAIVEKHPEAFADHAARFWLGQGKDSNKALELARLNAKLRETEESLDLWNAAAAAANNKEDLCTSAKKIEALPYATEKLKKLAAGVKCQ